MRSRVALVLGQRDQEAEDGSEDGKREGKRDSWVWVPRDENTKRRKREGMGTSGEGEEKGRWSGRQGMGTGREGREKEWRLGDAEAMRGGPCGLNLGSHTDEEVT